MSADVSPILVAAGLGIATTLHPCPFAGNIAAVSWLSGWPGQKRRTVIAAGCYALGRVITYGILAMALTFGILSAASTADVLQQTVARLTGPLFVLAGMAAAGLLPFRLKHHPDNLRSRYSRATGPKAFLLGVVLSLSFCPASAGLFFGALIPMAFNQQDPFLLSGVYAGATAVPIIGTAAALSCGLRFARDRIGRIETFERWVPRIIGGVLILTGIYLSLQRVYKLFNSAVS